MTTPNLKYLLQAPYIREAAEREFQQALPGKPPVKFEVDPWNSVVGQ